MEIIAASLRVDSCDKWKRKVNIHTNINHWVVYCQQYHQTHIDKTHVRPLYDHNDAEVTAENHVRYEH